MALPLFVRKLTAPVAVKRVLSALSEEVRHINNDPRRALGASMGVDIVAPKVTEDILSWSKKIKNDIQNGRSPRIIALYLMMNVARNYLVSGKFAVWAGVYRGMNSLSMQGHAIYGLNAYCLDELTKVGEMTLEQKAAALEATKEEIQNIA